MPPRNRVQNVARPPLAAPAAAAAGTLLGGSPASTPPTTTGGRSGISVVQVSLSSDGHACAVERGAGGSGGSVVCWGAIGGPQGGTYRAGGGPYLQVATASGFTCALRVDGTLDCWGEAPRVWAAHAASAPQRDQRFLEIAAQ